MTDIIRDAVRAGWDAIPKEFMPGLVAIHPGSVMQIALETAARHAAEAMRKKAAVVVEASPSSPINANRDDWLAKLIRAIPTGDTP